MAALEYHDSIGSTNDRALELARGATVPVPLLVLAARQTAGRGRGTNRWWSSPGALTFSYVTRLPKDVDRARWPPLALSAAVAVCELIEELAPSLQPGIRWPNDVYVAGRKISGILAEVPAAAADPLLVLGLGLNVNNSLADAPREIATVGTALVDLAGEPFELTDVLLRLLQHVERQAARWTAGDPALARRWSALCLLRGRRVALRLGERSVEGHCHGIAADGALELETPAGRQRFFGGALVHVE